MCMLYLKGFMSNSFYKPLSTLENCVCRQSRLLRGCTTARLPMLKVPKSHSPAHYFDNVSKEDNGCSILNGKVINVQKQMI